MGFVRQHSGAGPGRSLTRFEGDLHRASLPTAASPRPSRLAKTPLFTVKASRLQNLSFFHTLDEPDPHLLDMWLPDRDYQPLASGHM